MLELQRDLAATAARERAAPSGGDGVCGELRFATADAFDVGALLRLQAELGVKFTAVGRSI